MGVWEAGGAEGAVWVEDETGIETSLDMLGFTVRVHLK